LRYTLDSLQKNYTKDVLSYSENIYQRAIANGVNSVSAGTKLNLDRTDVIKNFTPTDKTQILRVAGSYIDATTFSLDNSKFELDEKQK